MSWTLLKNHLKELDGLLYAADPASIREKLRDIVPEYTYPEESSAAERRVPMTNTSLRPLRPLAVLDASE